MENQEIGYAIENIDEILEKISRKKAKCCPDFGNDIFVPYLDIEKTIKRIDDLLTSLAHDGVCSNCYEQCKECELFPKKIALKRVEKIIKGDWSPNHK